MEPEARPVWSGFLICGTAVYGRVDCMTYPHWTESAFVVMTVRAIELTREHAAFLEMPSLIGTDMDRCGPIFRINSLSPCTMRSPRLTRCSDGKPPRRLRVDSKADVSLEFSSPHSTSPYGRLDRRRPHRKHLFFPADEVPHPPPTGTVGLDEQKEAIIVRELYGLGSRCLPESIWL